MDRIEQKILEIIEKNADKICAFGQDIWTHAELGFQEFRTSGKFQEEMDKLGIKYEKELAVTGVKAYLKEQTEGEIRLALMGEMDALPFPNHKDANPETGAAHCCGHNAQLTGVMGAALALSDPEVKAALGGNVIFFAVPSEEASTAPELEREMMADGRIRYIGGKSELIRIGAVDDIDLTVGHHVNVGPDGDSYVVSNSTSMGFIEKYIKYTGIAQHPANSPKSIDALSAATLAMHAIDLQREAINHFFDWNTHILHGFIHNGGRATNIISDNVDMDYDIRARTPNAMLDIAYRVDRSLKGAAMAMGAGLEIETVPGYLPVQPVKDASVVDEVFELVDPEHKHKVTQMTPDMVGGTTDFGDLSCIMPVLQFNTSRHTGTGHTDTFDVKDPYEYYVTPAKCFALLAYRLLKNNAEKAKQLLKENKPLMTKADYLNYMETVTNKEKVDMVPVPEKFI